MFSFIKKFANRQNSVIYIRFKKESIEFYTSLNGLVYSDLALIALNKQKNPPKITAVGRGVMQLTTEDPSVVYAPFDSFDSFQEDFDLAEKVLRGLLKKSGVTKGLFVAPKIIMHPDRSALSEMQEQIYYELGLLIGGRECTVHVGEKLEIESFESKFK